MIFFSSVWDGKQEIRLLWPNYDKQTTGILGEKTSIV